MILKPSVRVVGEPCTAPAGATIASGHPSERGYHLNTRKEYTLNMNKLLLNYEQIVNSYLTKY